MPLNIIPIPAFNDNYIWMMVNPDNQHAIIVDPGDAEPVLKVLAEQKIILDAILITHHHYDHTHGIADIVQAYSVPVYTPMNGEITLSTDKVSEGDKVAIENLSVTFNVIEIPGHTLDHLAYHAPGVLFCGDTLFMAGCGRLFEGTAEQMVNSLSKLTALPDETLAYCGHEYTEANLKFAKAVEPNNQVLTQRIVDTHNLRQQGLPTVPATLSLEKQTNPFLRCHVPEVIKSAEDHAGQTLKNTVDVFRVIREWKDGF